MQKCNEVSIVVLVRVTNVPTEYVGITKDVKWRCALWHPEKAGA